MICKQHWFLVIALSKEDENSWDCDSDNVYMKNKCRVLRSLQTYGRWL